jgi:hypothetical protein
MHALDRFHDVFALLCLDLQRGDVQTLAVECAILMGDEYHAFQTVHGHQKTQLLDESFFIPVRREMAREAGSAPRQGEAIIARKLQPIVQKFVYLLAPAPVAAIDCRGANAVGVKLYGALVEHACHNSWL